MSGFNFHVVRSGKRSDGLGPPAAGGPAHEIYIYLWTSDFYFLATAPFVGRYEHGFYPFYYIDTYQAAVEFDLQGGTTTLPTVDMTAYNFTAKLDGLTAADVNGAGAMNVYLFDMGDGTEDGAITVADFDSIRYIIASSIHTFGGAPADFNDIDVTDAVRNDLFGAGSGDFSGFILKCPDAPSNQRVRFNPATVTLTITPEHTCDCKDYICFIDAVAH